MPPVPPFLLSILLGFKQLQWNLKSFIVVDCSYELLVMLLHHTRVPKLVNFSPRPLPSFPGLWVYIAGENGRQWCCSH